MDLKLARMVLLIFLLLGGQHAALAGPFKGRFTGVFYGQGEGCWGGLFVRTKTIEWEDGNDLSCRRTPYSITDQSPAHALRE
jgi:hypothetical protein